MKLLRFMSSPEDINLNDVSRIYAKGEMLIVVKKNGSQSRGYCIKEN